MHLRAFQAHIEAIYGQQDRKRGAAASYLWFVEEVGELAEEVRKSLSPAPEDDAGRAERLRHEVGDVLAWLSTLASMLDVDLEAAAARYEGGCPRCKSIPCHCDGV